MQKESQGRLQSWCGKLWMDVGSVCFVFGLCLGLLRYLIAFHQVDMVDVANSENKVTVGHKITEEPYTFWWCPSIWSESVSFSGCFGLNFGWQKRTIPEKVVDSGLDCQAQWGEAFRTDSRSFSGEVAENSPNREHRIVFGLDFVQQKVTTPENSLIWAYKVK